MKKPRWLLAHENIIIARRLLKDLRISGTALKRDSLKIKKNNLLGDLRLIDMYEEAILESEPLSERRGNWVHKFNRTEQLDRFLIFQFYRYQEVQAYIEEHFKNGPPFFLDGGEE